jgi:hypothetical protein
MKKILILLFVVIPICVDAQSIPGEYILEDSHEVASVFELRSDSTFSFYFAYGASERYAEGIWVAVENDIVLNSPVPEKPDFILMSSEAKKGVKKFTVRIVDVNEMILPYVIVTLKSGKETKFAKAGHDGVAEFGLMNPDTVYLQHEIWQNEPVKIIVTDKKINYYEFSINPDIIKVRIKDMKFNLTGNDLTGPHPLLDGRFTYRKQ